VRLVKVEQLNIVFQELVELFIVSDYKHSDWRDVLFVINLSFDKSLKNCSTNLNVFRSFPRTFALNFVLVVESHALVHARPPCIGAVVSWHSEKVVFDLVIVDNNLEVHLSVKHIV